MFCFGLRADAVAQLKSLGYDPRLFVEGNRALQRVVEAIANGDFSAGDTGRYRALVDKLLSSDPYLLMADFASYLQAQEQVDALYRDRKAWAQRVVANVAGMGWFSADRTVAEYAERVWSVKSLG